MKSLYFLIALSAVIVISAYPTTIAFATDFIDIFTLSLNSFLWAGVAGALVWYLIFPRRIRCEHVLALKSMSRNFWLSVIAAGIFRTANDLLYFFAVKNGNPIEVHLFIYFYVPVVVVTTPFFTSKKLRYLSLSELLLVVVTLVGAIVASSGIGTSSLLRSLSVEHYAALGAGLCGIFFGLTLRASYKMEEKNITPFGAIYVTSCLVSLSSLFFIFFLQMTPWVPSPSLILEFDLMLYVLLIGVIFILFFESIWPFAVRSFQGVEITSLIYLSPAISAFLITTFRDESISVLTLFGILCVVGGNIILHIGKNYYSSSVSFFISLLLFGILAYFISGSDRGDLITVAVAGFSITAILAGFVLNRVYDKYREMDGIHVQLIETMRRNTSSIDKKEKAEDILSSIRMGDEKLDASSIECKFDIILKANTKSSGAEQETIRNLYYKFVHLSLTRIRAIETWLILSSSIVFSVVLVASRPNSFLADILVVFIATILVILYSIIGDYDRYVLDQNSMTAALLRNRNGQAYFGEPIATRRILYVLNFVACVMLAALSYSKNCAVQDSNTVKDMDRCEIQRLLKPSK